LYSFITYCWALPRMFVSCRTHRLLWRSGARAVPLPWPPPWTPLPRLRPRHTRGLLPPPAVSAALVPATLERGGAAWRKTRGWLGCQGFARPASAGPRGAFSPRPLHDTPAPSDAPLPTLPTPPTPGHALSLYCLLPPPPAAHLPAPLGPPPRPRAAL